MKTIEFDIVFISYDEPNADINYADLRNKVPWARRIHGVKGSDNAHKAAAAVSDTDWFITVDADNIVDAAFFSVDVDMSDSSLLVYSWCGRNKINGLRYGNGGLKLWNKEYVIAMKTHESADSASAQVDFCWEDKYWQSSKSFSSSIVNGSPFQAWRAGFREGVKMTLLDGVRIPAFDIKERVWWHNLHRLRMWASVGSHEEYGLFSIFGARLGAWMTNCTDWDFVEVRDFDKLRAIYESTTLQFENNFELLVNAIIQIGDKINVELGFDWPYLSSAQSKYTLDLYLETLNLNNTYYIEP
jgi:hypothetical protein